MNMLRRIWRWWRQLWAYDFNEPGEVDSHKWENKAEILRRLTTCPTDGVHRDR